MRSEVELQENPLSLRFPLRLLLITILNLLLLLILTDHGLFLPEFIHLIHLGLELLRILDHVHEIVQISPHYSLRLTHESPLRLPLLPRLHHQLMLRKLQLARTAPS